jgi:fucose permease
MPAFARDRFTWLAYIMLGYYAYVQAILGPSMPFLRTELNLSYTEAGLHFSAFALGMALSGISADRLAHRFGYKTVFWAGAFGMALFALLLSAGQVAVVTITTTFLMAYTGSGLLVMIQTTLAEKHGMFSTVALTEANVIASIGATLAPALIGFAAGIVLGWRAALYAAVLICAVVFFAYRSAVFPSFAYIANVQKTANLPPKFWIFTFITALAGSIEWCVVLWCADFLEKVLGLAKADASAAVSVYFFANVIGRFLGSRFARVMSTETLLLAVVCLALVGFPLFWISGSATLALVGLFITGLGVGNLFPFTLSAAARAFPEDTNTVSARISMAMGIAILVTPQVLAIIADQIGIQRAYTVVIILLVMMLISSFGVYRMARKPIAEVAA